MRKSMNRRFKKQLRRVLGTSTRPRLCVFRSNKYIYAQLIDDGKGITLVSEGKKVKGKVDKNEDLNNKYSKTQTASLVGEHLAEKAIKKGIMKVTFDRRSYKFHGRVKSLAEGARKKGLIF